jgi:putative effector of murein hydrolase
MNRGWKTILGSVTAMIAAVVGAYLGDIPITEALTTVSEGIIAIGIGHKLDKIRKDPSLDILQPFQPGS